MGKIRSRRTRKLLPSPYSSDNQKTIIREESGSEELEISQLKVYTSILNLILAPRFLMPYISCRPAKWCGIACVCIYKVYYFSYNINSHMYMCMRETLE